jgi:excinuclease ABC subunit A
VAGLPPTAKQALLYGQNRKVHVKYKNRYGRERSYYDDGFEGVVPFVKRRHCRDRLRRRGALRGLHA